jgi:thymidylate kinase
MNNKEILITITGACGSGKSNIAYFLLKYLRENGFDISLESSSPDFESEEDFIEQLSVRNEMAISNLKQDRKILLKEVNSNLNN